MYSHDGTTLQQVSTPRLHSVWKQSPLSLFLKHGPEQKQLIFQFPINLGKKPSRCQKFFIERQLCLLSWFQVPNTTEQVTIWLSRAECFSGLADKTVQHDRRKKRKFSLLSQCAVVLRLKKGFWEAQENQRKITLQMKTHLYQKLNLNEHYLCFPGW